MDARDALVHAGGAARWVDLARRGVSRGALLGAVAAGDVDRPARGVFALPHCLDEMVRSVEFRAPLTCVSALQMWGIPLLHVPTSTHLAVESAHHVDTGRALARSVVVHRGDYVQASGGGQGVRVAHPVAALKSASQCVSPREHLVVADALLHAGLVSAGDLTFGGGGTSSRSAWLRTRADARAESPLESLARLDLVEGGLRVEPQVYFRGVGRVDMLVQGKLVVETDGREYHDAGDAFARGRKRDRALHGMGFVVLRFTRKDVVSTPGLVLADTLRALQALAQRSA